MAGRRVVYGLVLVALATTAARGATMAVVSATGTTGAAGSRETGAAAGAPKSGAASDMGAQALADRVASGAWDTFSTRVTVRRQWIGTDGTLVKPADAAHEYVLERERTSTGWRTRVTVADGPRPVIRTRQGDVTLTDELAVQRMEDNEDGSAPRFFNRAGVEVLPTSGTVWQRLMAGRFAGVERSGASIASASAEATSAPGLDVVLRDQASAIVAPRRTEGREWIEAFVMAGGRAPARLDAVTRQFGRRIGTVRGYAQFVRQTGGRRLELLLDEQDGVPVESNVVEQGLLQSRSTFSYERAASGAILRRGVRVEQLLQGQAGALSGTRVITEVSYSDIQLSTKGGR